MRSPSRLHERQSFFKYMPAATAALVLKNRALRWSSPHLFNDPFDVPREFSTNITARAIAEALSPQIMDLIENPPQDTSGLKPQLRHLIDLAKRGVSEETKVRLYQGLTDIAKNHNYEEKFLDDLRQFWVDTIPNLRILCLTESPSHMAMWHHYADKYQGVVIEFKCIDEIDSAWLVARPITYPIEKPPIYTTAGWARLAMLESGYDNLLLECTLTKSSDWSYEKEWRVTSLKRKDGVGHFTDFPFFEQEIGQIFFGPRISAADRSLIMHLGSRYPNVNFFDVSIGLDREFIFHSANRR